MCECVCVYMYVCTCVCLRDDQTIIALIVRSISHQKKSLEQLMRDYLSRYDADPNIYAIQVIVFPDK